MKKILIITFILLFKNVLSQPIQNKYKNDWNDICRGNFNMYMHDDEKSFLLKKDTSLKGKVFTFIVGYDMEEKIRSYQEYSYILTQKGASVYQIYGNQNYQQSILNILRKSDVIVYSGHGDFKKEYNWIGLMFIKKDNNEIMIFDNHTFKDFKFKEGSVFLFDHSCFAAGISASDTGNISKEESIYRSSVRASFLLDHGIDNYFASVGGKAFTAFGFILEKYLKDRSIEKYIKNFKRWKDGLSVNTYQEVENSNLRGFWCDDSVYWIKK